MWRKCDLHTHTTPNEQSNDPFSAADFVMACLAEGLDVVAVTDHDSTAKVEAVMEVAATDAPNLSIVAGCEIRTTQGDVLALAPDGDGLALLETYCARLGVGTGELVRFEDLVQLIVQPATADGKRFRDGILILGAHVDQAGSLLGPQPLQAAEQVTLAFRLDALEVVRDEVREQWAASGVKQSGRRHALVRGSDSHDPKAWLSRSCWLYLDDVSAQAFRQAFGTYEASISLSEVEAPQVWIRSVAFEGGMHDGRVFQFCERMNALIGPPSSGKSLVLDAIRFALDIPIVIPEIRELIAARLSRALGDNSRVTVVLETGHGPLTVERTLGGARSERPAAVPIIFSQTELVRRAMERSPSVELIDVHAPETLRLKDELRTRAGQIKELLQNAMQLAAEARALGEVVRNEADGLSATRTRLRELAGSEDLALESDSLARAVAWRSRVAASIDGWLADFQDLPVPEIPVAPELTVSGLERENVTPELALRDLFQRFRTAVRKEAELARDRAHELLRNGEAEMSAQDSRIRAGLVERGIELAADALAELDRLRQWEDHLVEQAEKLKVVEETISDQLGRLQGSVEELNQARLELRNARKSACRSVNQTMADFYCRLEEESLSTKIDDLLKDLKTGTWKQTSSLAETRNSLDRPRVLTFAVRRAQARPDLMAADDVAVDQDVIVGEAVDRGKVDSLAALACAWPGDSLVIVEKGSNTSFEGLTEGMRALAIKEVSFAASSLPVVSDQPEDAVPPQAVFDRLVPTLREQRVRRQFILASHDANIVVTGDADRVFVLGPEGTPQPGTMFDETICNTAIELLEGGREAFRRRSERYKDR